MLSKRRSLCLFVKIYLVFLAFMVYVLSVSAFFEYRKLINNARDYLNTTSKRVRDDIKYKNGIWDTSLYNSDIEIPDTNPLYVITSQGFVIERRKPIHGFLDTTKFNRLLAYDKPETITTVTNEKWRILSRQIKSNGEVVGVVTVTSYKPEENNLDYLDQQLENILDGIYSKLIAKGDDIDFSKIDARQVPYNISFQIVNRFNKLLIHNDHASADTPSFIDNSYVDFALSGSRERYVSDIVTHKEYLVKTTPILDSKGSVVGIISAGFQIVRQSEYIYQELFGNLGVTFFNLLLFSPLIYWLISKHTREIRKDIRSGAIFMPKKIIFNKQSCKLIIDNHKIDIPYATNQYYFCSALFSKPQKRWEADVLLEKFGEELSNKSWRKVYDTMVALNKKTFPILNKNLFVIEDKTYRINPTFLSKIYSLSDSK